MYFRYADYFIFHYFHYFAFFDKHFSLIISFHYFRLRRWLFSFFVSWFRSFSGIFLRDWLCVISAEHFAYRLLHFFDAPGPITWCAFISADFFHFFWCFFEVAVDYAAAADFQGIISSRWRFLLDWCFRLRFRCFFLHFDAADADYFRWCFSIFVAFRFSAARLPPPLSIADFSSDFDIFSWWLLSGRLMLFFYFRRWYFALLMPFFASFSFFDWWFRQLWFSSFFDASSIRFSSLKISFLLGARCRISPIIFLFIFIFHFDYFLVAVGSCRSLLADFFSDFLW